MDKKMLICSVSNCFNQIYILSIMELFELDSMTQLFINQCANHDKIIQ